MNTDRMVYILDDDAGVRKSLGWMLESSGFAFMAFDSSQTFVDEVIVSRPSCLLLDMNLPGMNGVDVLHEVSKKPHLHMPVIILTGNGNISLAVECIKLGARDFLEKPIDHGILIARLNDSLAAHTAQRDNESQVAELKLRVKLLTDREREVLSLLCQGKSTKEMALKLSISAKTVSIHRWHLMKKMQAGNATEAVHLAYRAHAA